MDVKFLIIKYSQLAHNRTKEYERIENEFDS